MHRDLLRLILIWFCPDPPLWFHTISDIIQSESQSVDVPVAKRSIGLSISVGITRDSAVVPCGQCTIEYDWHILFEHLGRFAPGLVPVLDH